MTKTDSPERSNGPGGAPWQAGGAGAAGAAPFILIDDARPGGRARLYRDPGEILETRDPGQVRACLARLHEGGGHLVGFIAYEAGHALEPRLAPHGAEPPTGAPPLLWFARFDGFEEVEAEAVLPDPASAWAGRPRPTIDRSDYQAAVAEAKAHIEAGNIYQANLTFAATVRTLGDPRALYAAIRARAQGGHSALVFTGDHWLLSFSPELFFTLERGLLTARPMKGTAVRRGDRARDEEAARLLQADPKQRAENLMIVDLLRNDLSRVSRPGSVEVPELFVIETYPTVHQMTSTVTAGLADGLGPVDVIEAIFPCGSITGAPKIRAMEIIAGLERTPRGVYTGSIGAIAPDGSAAFNVAIRTLVMKAGEREAVIGLGSGIVADSVAADEWRECLAKGAFVESGRSVDLIETMRFDPDEGVVDLERHIARMKASAEALDFTFDRHHVRNELQAATFRLKQLTMLRLLLSPSGAIAIESRAVPPLPAEPVTVALVRRTADRADFRLRHKTSDRALYDPPRIAAGTFEIVFTDEDGFLTEGSFTSLFVERDGELLTPPLDRGLLPGILRARLIEEGRARESELRPEDLEAGFLIGNAVRGLIAARL